MRETRLVNFDCFYSLLRFSLPLARFLFHYPTTVARLGVGNEERDIVSTARVCSTPVLRGGCNVARKNTVNSTATGPVCLTQKSAGRSRNMTSGVRGVSRRLAASLHFFVSLLFPSILRDYYDYANDVRNLFVFRRFDFFIYFFFLLISASIENLLKIK